MWCGFGLSGVRSSNLRPAAATASLHDSFLALHPLCGTRWCPVLPTARANADVSATSTSQHRTGRRNGVASRDSFGDCHRLCRGAYLGTVATRARALARYERWSVPAGRATTGTSDLEHLLAWPHDQRSPRRSSRSQPRDTLIPASPPPAPPFPRKITPIRRSRASGNPRPPATRGTIGGPSPATGLRLPLQSRPPLPVGEGRGESCPTTPCAR